MNTVPQTSGAGTPAALHGLTVFERGWLSSNNVLFHGHDGGTATLVDSSHCLHAEQTLALLRAALGAEKLGHIVNTHLHSDHCGGNAAVQREFAAPLSIPSGSWNAVLNWDLQHLSFSEVGQRIEKFSAQAMLGSGDELRLGGRPWQVIAAPGHDPDAVMLFDAEHGVLISGDALWQNGFGVVFPELDGNSGFDEVGQVLEQIACLPVQWVIPGHGSAFNDIGPALSRARSRLASFRADPQKHARYGAKVLLKYHLMEEQTQPLADLYRWAQATPLLRRLWIQQQRPAGTLQAWCDELLADLQRSSAAELRDGLVCNR